MLDALYAAWQVDRAAGLSTLMIAGNSEAVAELNQRARADLIDAGRVEPVGVLLHDGTTAGIGDLVVTRRNDRALSPGRSWVKNADRWQVALRYDDGSLAVRRVGKGDVPHGKALVLPAGYVADEVELGYAATAHRAQGSTVDTAHALIDPEKASRELFYVAMTRGRVRNEAYVIQPDPHEVEPHLDRPEEKTVTGHLSRVLARSDADLSATEALAREVDRHASLATLLDEFDLLAREAHAERWAVLLDVAPFPEGVTDDVFTSPYYEHLEGALARHEAAGHDVNATLTTLAPTISPGEEQADPAARLATALDSATMNLAAGRGKRPRRVAGLIPIPDAPAPDDVHTALDARRALIETAARRSAQHELRSSAAWTSKLQSPTDQRARGKWLEQVATVALYRSRYGIASAAPLGNPKDITKAQQASEYRAAYAALRRAQFLADPATHPTPHRQPPQAGASRSL